MCFLKSFWINSHNMSRINNWCIKISIQIIFPLLFCVIHNTKCVKLLTIRYLVRKQGPLIKFCMKLFICIETLPKLNVWQNSESQSQSATTLAKSFEIKLVRAWKLSELMIYLYFLCYLATQRFEQTIYISYPFLGLCTSKEKMESL